MINLTGTDSLVITLTDDPTIPLFAVVDFSDKGTGYDPLQQKTRPNGTSPVTICAAPATGDARSINRISVVNPNPESMALTLSIYDGLDYYEIGRAVLAEGERVAWTHASDMKVNLADGSTKSGAVQDLSGYQLTMGKDASDGYVGLTGFAINFKNVLGTIVSLFTNAATSIRTYTFPDKSGTVAMTSDVVTDHTALSNIGTNTHAQIDTHIASTANPHAVTKTQVGLANVDNTSDANKPVSTAQANADAAVLSTAQSYADGLVVGLLDDRGNFDASANTWPTTGGSGAAGAVKKGDLWTISVAGALGGHAVTAGDVIRALTDTPGSIDANWAIAENNFGYVAENSANKNASGGYAGLTLFKLNLLNALGTVTSWFTTAATVARTWTLPDKDGTVAMTSDITGTNSGTNTGDETGARLATLHHAASVKSALVDADEVTGGDSAASFGLIRTTWTSVKAFLKTYFDTLYQAVLVSGTNIKTINSTSLLGSGDIAISASPGGSTTQLQYNDAGAFAGDASLLWDKTNKTLTIKAFSTTPTPHVLSIADSAGTEKIWGGYGGGVWQWHADYFIAGTEMQANSVKAPSGWFTMNSSGLEFLFSSSPGSNGYFQLGTGGSADVRLVREAAGQFGIRDTGSNYRDLKLRGITFGGTYTVATLPTGVDGLMVRVTDLSSLTNGSTAAGSGSNKGTVVYSGAATAWIVLG